MCMIHVRIYFFGFFYKGLPTFTSCEFVQDFLKKSTLFFYANYLNSITNNFFLIIGIDYFS